MTALPVIRKALVYGIVLALAIAVIGSIVGGIVAGLPGVLGALVGAGMAGVFLGLTAASILLATRVAKGQLFSGAFFGIVMGGWLLKLIVFFVLILVLSEQEFFDRRVLFITIVAAVVGSLAADVLAFSRSRMPYVDALDENGRSASADPASGSGSSER